MTANPFEDIKNQLDAILRELRKSQGNDKSTFPTGKEWGDIHFAATLTGYKIATIYLKVHKKEMPFIKRDGRLYFEKSALLHWIETGEIEPIPRKK